jgi:hypothetical protein
VCVARTADFVSLGAIPEISGGTTPAAAGAMYFFALSHLKIEGKVERRKFN